MMNTHTINAMQAHCDELTKDGKELSVTWEGGNDSGCLWLMLEGLEILPKTPLENEIVEFVEDYLGYGSFAGDFSTDGKVVYNRENKCFLGEDIYCENDEGSEECSIEFSIPEQIWFDRLNIDVEADGYEGDIKTSITLHILNGPYPDTFDKKQIEDHINKLFSQAVENIEDFAGIWERYVIERKDFISKNGMLHHKINSFKYSYEHSESKEINISFTE